MTMVKNLNTYLPWFALKEVPGIGALTYRRLLKQFKSPEKIFKASKTELARVRGVTTRIINGMQKKKIWENARLEIEEVFTRGYGIITLDDPLYPPLLREINDPPPLLTYIGTLDNSAPCLAMVGSRKATRYGMNTAFHLSSDMARLGFQIVSGMAGGIDTAAHQGALKAGGKTLAVLGSGLGNIYPRQNRGLFFKISENGAVVSEFKVTTKPLGGNFPRRNRIIAGLSAGTVVVEAAARSGALITARLAAEYGREVFAVPGSIDSPQSRGTHSLLKQGAKLVENPGDITEELLHLIHREPLKDKKSGSVKNAVFSIDDPCQKAILTVLEPYPIHIDLIIDQTGLDAGRITAALLDLEIQGVVKQLPGKQFIVTKEFN